MAEGFFFYLFAGLALASALMVVLGKHPLYSVLYLVVTMFSLAALFALLGAYFLAVIQILIYAGAILVLFLFVVMMLDLSKEGPSMRQSLGLVILGTLTSIAFAARMVMVLKNPQVPARAASGEALPDGSIEALGKVLFTEHLLAFELASFLMLAAILGCVVLSKKSWS